MLCIFHKCVRQTLIEYLNIDFFVPIFGSWLKKIKLLIFLKIVFKSLQKRRTKMSTTHDLTRYSSRKRCRLSTIIMYYVLVYYAFGRKETFQLLCLSGRTLVTFLTEQGLRLRLESINGNRDS